MRDALRTCLQIAGGLTEATRRRAVGAAKELLDQTGIDVDAVQRSIGERIPPEVQTLADELMASGRANRDLLVGLIREEIDKAMSRVGRLADEVTKVGVVLEALERRIRNLEDDDREPAWAGVTDDEPDPGMYVPPQPPVEHVPVDGQAPASAPAPGRKPEPTGAAGVTPVARKNAAPAHPPTASEASEAPAAQEPVGTAGAGAVPVARKNAAPAKAPAPKKAAPAARKTAPAKKAAPARTAAPAKKAAASGTGTGSTVKKAAPAAKKAALAAKKTTPAARKTAAATPAKKTAPAAKQATPATTPAKKTAAASRTSAPAKKTAATKSTAKKAAPARKAAPAKKTAARSQEAKGRD
ncbi:MULTISPECIES: hypothetical protein [unclassified Streptomyces]|uniref:hypothetical protein n=1 Tax=unclassified Streptomyces TaxID=2593676 RepID=UPI00037198D2|nr:MULTISPECIES: hypothetical protein [unclassified Streptomyces]MYX36531.1 histone [Streptomyces sp. SID8377]